MSKTRIGITVVVLATLLSSAAMARARLGIGPLGVARFAVTRVLSLGGLHHARGLARHGQIRTASLRSQDVRSVMDSGLGNPAVRRQIVASAALAGWHGGRTANAWWRHGDGGYGWVGPLYWPFAIYDIHDYAIWGGYGFWDYGYGDIYTGIFAPYGYDDLAGYFPQHRFSQYDTNTDENQTFYFNAMGGGGATEWSQMMRASVQRKPSLPLGYFSAMP